jgi:RNA polymerase sigma-70 factor (ECF subfamily)
LYRAHTPSLFRLAVRILGRGGPDAEEAVQNTWMRAVQGLHSFRWESSLRTWLAGITIHACREILRARTREKAMMGTPSSVEPAMPEPMPGAKIDLERIVAGLPDGYREILVLHDIEGFTHEEIARLLHIEPGTSKSQLSRARRLLRASLAPQSDMRVPQERLP